MFTLCAVVLFSLILCGTSRTDENKSTQDSAAPGKEWTQLFNGKNLDGWTPKITGFKAGENFGNTFRVVDGLLKVSYDGYKTFDGRFGHLFYKAPYGHYRMRVEYRFTGEQCPGAPGWAIRNSGVMIHGQTPDSMALKQKFPASIEVQLLGGLGSGERSTLNLCTPGTHVVMNGKLEKRHCIKSTSKTYHGDQWVTAELEVNGSGEVKHIEDGKVVLAYTQSQLDPSSGETRKLIEKQGGEVLLTGGTISLQSEGHPIEFRKVELLEIKP